MAPQLCGGWQHTQPKQGRQATQMSSIWILLRLWLQHTQYERLLFPYSATIVIYDRKMFMNFVPAIFVEASFLLGFKKPPIRLREENKFCPVFKSFETFLSSSLLMISAKANG